MEIPTIKAETRKASGSRAAARLRNAGKLPAIVYGHEEEAQPVAIDYHSVEHHVAHGTHLINLDIGGKVQPCLLKDAQYDHLGSALLHLDLARIDLNERVTVQVTVELRGTPKGIADGGVLRQELQELSVECLATEIPETIRVNVADLALNQVMYVKDLKLEGSLKAMSDPEAVVATVRPPLAESATTETAAPAEGAAEPEVIAKGKIEEAETAEE